MEFFTRVWAANLVCLLLCIWQKIYQPADQTADPIVMLLGLTVVLTLSVQLGWRYWQGTLVVLREENPGSKLGQLVGSPFFDPREGICCKAILDGMEHTLVINPEYWHLLPRESRPTEEAAVRGNPMNFVSPGKEEASYVLIKAAEETGTVVGAGARVKFRGKTYLLTANHVWHGRTPKLCIAKAGRVADVDFSWPIVYGCDHHQVDFVMVRVPDAVWTKLGVKAATLDLCEQSQVVSVYGGQSSMKLNVGTGWCKPREKKYLVEHTCPTTAGWSGAPLYRNGKVVAVHLGSLQEGVTNRGVNVGLLLGLTQETWHSEVSYNPFDYEDMDLRKGEEYLEVEIKGIGKVALGSNDYALSLSEREKRFKAPAWSQQEDDDFFAQPVAEFLDCFGTMESPEEHLNCSGAAGPRSLPPLVHLGGIAGKPAIVPQEACLSSASDARLCALERLVETLIENQAQLTLKLSQSLKDLSGQNEAVMPSGSRSPSKPVVLQELRPQTTLGKALIGSSSSTQNQDQGEASGEKNGKKKRSRKRSRKSRKGKSIGKLPLASPCQS